MDYPNDIVTEASRYLLGRGITILQGNRLGDSEEEHVARLASYMALNGEREVADMGCGFGAVSWHLHNKAIPKAHFWLVNRNRFQLGHCPLGKAFTRLLEDMCYTSIPDGVVDLVMFNYSLCHVEQFAALKEAARISRPGGKLFVYDYQRVSGDNDLTEKILAARFLSDEEFRVHAEATGWHDIETISPGGDDHLFREAVNDDALYDEMFDHLQPVIWKGRKD
jgi:SAM-dependent methyltransferase